MGDFWGVDIEQYFPGFRQRPNRKAVSSYFAESDNDLGVQKDVAPAQRETVETKIKADTASLVDPFPLIAAAVQEETSQEFSKEKLHVIKLRYIVGNIAGENLSSRDGSLIVSKGSAITEAIVERAEAEGRISELIAFMTWPETEN